MWTTNTRQHFLQCSNASSSLLLLLLLCKGRGGRSCCSGLFYCRGRWCCSSHGAWRASLLICYNYRDVTCFQHRGSSTAPGEIWPAPPRPVRLRERVHRAQPPRQFQHQRPAGAERSCPHIQHFCCGAGNRSADSRAARRQTSYFSMASKCVGLFVLFQLLALNVVSQISAFPTPTASVDGELKPIVAVLHCKAFVRIACGLVEHFDWSPAVITKEIF